MNENIELALHAVEMQAIEEEWDVEQIMIEVRRVLVEEDVITGFEEYD